MTAAFTAVHDEQAFGLEATALEQVLDALLEFLVFQWRELVEQRCNDRWRNELNKQPESDSRNPGVQPPVVSGGAHQPQQDRQKRKAQYRGYDETDDEILYEQGWRHFVEAELLFNHEGTVQVKRNVDHRHQQAEIRKVQNAAPQIIAQQIPGKVVESLKNAAEDQYQQDRCIENDASHGKARLCNGVISGLLVRIESDVGGERFRNSGAMRRHVIYMAPCKPQAGCCRYGDGDQEKDRESIHGCVCDWVPVSDVTQYPNENSTKNE